MTDTPHAASTSDGSAAPDHEPPPPADAATPVPEAPPGDEGARQSTETIRSISRLEEAN